MGFPRLEHGAGMTRSLSFVRSIEWHHGTTGDGRFGWQDMSQCNHHSQATDFSLSLFYRIELTLWTLRTFPSIQSAVTRLGSNHGSVWSNWQAAINTRGGVAGNLGDFAYNRAMAAQPQTAEPPLE